MKEISLETINKLSLELTEIQTDSINKVVALADKYGLDRDFVFASFVDVLTVASQVGTFKEYKITKTGAEWKEHMMQHFTKGE